MERRLIGYLHCEFGETFLKPKRVMTKDGKEVMIDKVVGDQAEAGATRVPSRARLHLTRPTRLENMVLLTSALSKHCIPFAPRKITAVGQDD